jgi:hypothetical protein
MKEIIVIYRNRNTYSKTLVKNNLQWYDPIKKEIQKFEGGQLEFEYKEDEYLVAMGADKRSNRGIHSTFRLLPKVSDLETKSTSGVLDDKIFIKFFDDYLNYNNSSVTIDVSNLKRAVCFVPDEEVEDFGYQLNRQGFNYEIE